MGILYPIATLLGGLLAAATVVIAKIPSAKNLVQKLVPFQAAIGLAVFVFAVFNIFDWGTATSQMKGGMRFVTMASIGANLLVGFLLGYPLVQSFVLDEMSEAARTKAENIRKSLSPFQILAGLVALGAGVYILLFHFLLFKK